MAERTCGECQHGDASKRCPWVWCHVRRDWRKRAQAQCRLSEAERMKALEEAQE
jgi:hypothetical protein